MEPSISPEEAQRRRQRPVKKEIEAPVATVAPKAAPEAKAKAEKPALAAVPKRGDVLQRVQMAEAIRLEPQGTLTNLLDKVNSQYADMTITYEVEFIRVHWPRRTERDLWVPISNITAVEV